MREAGLSRRYAQALFTVAKERGVTEAVSVQFEALVALIRQNRAFVELLRSPKISPERKGAFLRATLEGQVSETLLEFLLLLRRKDRFYAVHDIATEYQKLVEADKGLLRASVTSAVPLRGDERERLKRVLEARSGLTVILEEQVDASVIGGAVVVLGGQIIDDSIRHHLDVLRDELRAVSLRGHDREV